MSTDLVQAPKIVPMPQRADEQSAESEIYLLNVIQPRSESGHGVIIGGGFNTITVPNDEVRGINALMKLTAPDTIESAMHRSRGAWLIAWGCSNEECVG